MHALLNFRENFSIFSNDYSLVKFWGVGKFCVVNQWLSLQVARMASHCSDDDFSPAEVPITESILRIGFDAAESHA